MSTFVFEWFEFTILAYLTTGRVYLRGDENDILDVASMRW